MIFYRFFLVFVPIFAQVTLNLNNIKRFQTVASDTVSTVAQTTVPLTTVPLTTVPLNCNAGCLTGWIPYSGNCYKKFEATVTQSEAEGYCSVYGAHLASIESGLEATAVKYLILESPFNVASGNLAGFLSSSQNAWIGLSKTANGAWSWTDSSEVLYTNLPSGESTTGASCATVNGTLWQPKSCSSTSTAYICKMAQSS
ncbi:unnamed protein product [Caenorhabditis angaria]|uniref:C-type lectin domain-containing protein n=1 Tax=Caenorhabditis angaria TaxID=860376 RepID=A0A9P1IRP6_9PELO|nr:unnamed protein product [Caenorhabditis angaria]